MTTPKPDFVAILQTLTTQGVDFIVVGGISGVLQGASFSTFDLDLVHSRKPENIGRLLAALDILQARYRTPGAEHLRPARSHLASEGHQLLMTRSGPLDLLGVIGSGHDYDDLLHKTIELAISGGVKVRVLELATLIDVKEETARDKDKAVLAILRTTLEEKKKSGK